MRLGFTLRPLRGGCLLRLSLYSALVAALLWCGYVLARIELAAYRDSPRTADAIVVLGAAQYQGTPSEVFRARLEYAEKLYREGYSRRIIVAGGKRRGDRYSEAETGVMFLRREGVPARALVASSQGTTTLTSLRALADKSKGLNVRSVLIVTDGFHLFRSVQMARGEGLEAYGSAARNSPVTAQPSSLVKYTAREVAAYTYYVLFRG